jgi:hypothetical protein
MEKFVFEFEQDGNQICCHRPDFTNLMESLAGFGDNEKEALEDLLIQEADNE